MAFKLQVIVGGQLSSTHEIVDGVEYVIGRESTNDIVVNDRSVSRTHCAVKVARGGLEFVDRESANGLYVNGVQHKRVTLRDGDILNIGMAQLRLAQSTNHTGMIPIGGFLDGFPSDLESSHGESGRWESSSGFRRGGERPRPAPPSEDRGSSSSMLSSARPEYKVLEKERLALLVETAKSLGQSTDLDALLNQILLHLFEIVRVKRAVVALTEDCEHFTVAAAEPRGEKEDLGRVASQSILRRIAQSRRGEIIEDAALDRMLQGNMSIVASNIRAAICVPILANNRCLGCIYADFPGHPRLYSNADLEFLTAFASIAAVSIENSRMMQRIREDDALRRDLEIAAEIQQGILPNAAFTFPGLEIDWAYWPSLHVGGDFYDFIDLKDGRVAVVIGDVSGKSIPAALYMARTLSFMRAIVSASEPPGSVLTKVNALLGESGERLVFATTFVMIVDPGEGRILWSNAGHNPPIVVDPAKGQPIYLDAEGPMLGVDPTLNYLTSELDVAPGTTITLYTDGLVEARNAAETPLGVENVLAILETSKSQPINASTKAMIDSVARHVAGSPKTRDDVAIVNIRIGPRR